MESKKSFIKGALCGALTMLVIAGIIVGVFMATGFGTEEDGLIASSTQQKLQVIREMIESKLEELINADI